ncbi:MAG: GMC family oxidoreductase [Deltaproteobacteria bacterium]|nr:GMC family oxidoreductase [Deltaproteobacteria bacterium]
MKAPELYNAARLERNLVLSADVAVVGTGAGGGVCAEILSASGLRVVMIEEGPYRMAADFTLRELDAYKELYQENSARKTADGAVTILQGRAVGGSTTVNWTTSLRTPTPTLDYWRESLGVRGFSAADFQPWFQRMERRMGVAPWTIPPNANNAALARGAEKLGWAAEPIPRNVKGCLNLGYCGLGCPVDAKQSTLITSIPEALRAGAALVYRARADRLLLANGRVTGLECTALAEDGAQDRPQRITLMAPVVVVAGGAIHSPALLLRTEVPDPYKRLGMRTFLHPSVACLGRMPETVDAFAGAPQSVYSDHFLWRDGVTGAAGFKLETPPLQPVLAMSSVYRFDSTQVELIRSYRHHHALIALMRDGFHPDSPGGVVRLRGDGSPLLDYPVTPYLLEGMGKAQAAMIECQFAAGAQWVLPVRMDAQPLRSWTEARRSLAGLKLTVPELQVFSAHVMGGCAMGEDPRHSVVDSNGRHHQVESLYVMDGSVFPTSLGANPQLTIFALAARNAAALAVALGKTPPPWLLS